MFVVGTRTLVRSEGGPDTPGPHEKGAQMPKKTDGNGGGDWQEIQPFTEPITLDEGQEIVAWYLGANEVTVPAKKDEDGAYEKDGDFVRNALLHEFTEDTSSGEPQYGIWGSAVLDKRLADVPAKSRVKIVYEGKTELEGGRTARRYRVFVDRSASF